MGRYRTGRSAHLDANRAAARGAVTASLPLLPYSHTRIRSRSAKHRHGIEPALALTLLAHGLSRSSGGSILSIAQPGQIVHRNCDNDGQHNEGRRHHQAALCAFCGAWMMCAARSRRFVSSSLRAEQNSAMGRRCCCAPSWWCPSTAAPATAGVSSRPCSIGHARTVPNARGC